MNIIAGELVKIADSLLRVFDVTTADDWGREIQRGIKAAHVGVSKSTLGGDKHVALLILVALDPKSTWKNGILENSRYFRLHLSNDGTLEMFGGQLDPSFLTRPKAFRKTRVVSADDVVTNVNRYISYLESARSNMAE